LTSGGSGYTAQPIVVFSLPNLPGGVQATGTATMTAGVVDGVTVVDPGSGYTSAPTITIKDAGQTPLANPAVAVATIGILRIDVTSGGQGYDSAPTVAINDTVGTPDKGASATAMVAVKGAVTAINVTAPGAGYLTPGLKKFVDTLPGLGSTNANDLGQYIPVAVPDTTTYPGSDYYEIAVVQYRMKFHRDLPATLLRGYVQLSTSVVPGNSVPLTNANLDPAAAAAPVLLPDGSQAFGVDNPHYLGPTIVATKDRPVRILFRNLLPTGSAGNLFLPVDTSLMGAGMGPDMVELDPTTKVPRDMATDEGSVLDSVRNPACGETPKPAGCFTEDRATLHLHGGITPWISDGTPHQWTTPAGGGAAYPEGVSVSNVPDMPDPGPGALTFFYSNQQSARLMFYHDHAWGITRLNVYAGEAAGYLVTDAMEQALIAPGGALDGLGVGTPLVIQDKTFVSKNIASTDPTWDAARWGGEGSLWLPHVYMPAQNPGSPTGMNPFGRWMYGPWFWPPAKDAKYPPIANPYYDPACDPNVQPFCEPALIPSTPNISVGMEAFADTPIVNGAAYPTTTVDPKAYRYRILNAANDRFWNLQWYVADPTTGTLSEVALKPAELAAAQTDPTVFPTPDTTVSAAGPNWIQIGTEGGFLPDAVTVLNQPTTWITDPTRFDVGNVDKHSLLLAPAERADVIVDFSQFRGKTLILYNDAPAAFPARVAGYDYYTGGPDLSPVGAPTTLPGYGPNTRTIMQVKVSNAAPALAWDRPNTTADRMGTLVAEFKHHVDGSGKPAGVFESSVDPIIVGQAAYNTAYGTDFVASGWCNAPGATGAATTKCDGYARIQEGSQPTDLFGFNGLDGAFTPGVGKLQIPFQPKGMHDEANSASFDEWGRMTANLGLEAPGATPILQNIILYPYVNPATENLDATLGLPSSLHVTPISSSADGTQIWKITHNGVDTHPIHFHLYNVQVINRVTWDNIIIPPEPTELGWKETVRVSPLEDTIVALRPIVPTIPFGVLDSKRLLNPMMPLGARGSVNGVLGTEAGFNNTDTRGNPTTPIINEVVSFGWEYVFHCHILSHEEMDMMRPVTVKVTSAAPDAPVLTFARGSVIVKWTDGTPVNYADPTTWANPKNEVGFRIERAEVTGGVVGAYTQIGTALANTTSYTDLPPDPTIRTYSYRVTAYNAAGASTSAPLTVPPGGPTTTIVTSSVNPSIFGDSVTFTATVSPALATGTVQFNIDGVNVGLPQTVAAGVATFTTSSLTVGAHPVKATYGGDLSYFPSTSTPITQTVNQMATTTVVTSSLNPSFVGDSVTFTATVAPATGTGVPTGTVTFRIDGVAIASPPTLVGGKATYTTAGLAAGPHTVAATYNGDLNFVTSTSAGITQTVNKRATTSVVTSSLNPSFVGDSVTFTATVGPALATGTVTFRIDGVAMASPPTLVGGKATYTTSGLTAGPHTVTATYNGDAAYLLSTSATITQTVNRKTTATIVTSSLNPSFIGDSVTFTATVSPALATGTVTFRIDGVAVASPPTLVGGKATYTTSSLTAVAHSVTATYSGDAAYALSTSATITQTVSPLRPTATAVTSNRNPSAIIGQSIIFTAWVAPVTGAGVPAGTVQFSVDGVKVGGPVTLDATGRATYSTATLVAGSHSVIAAYSGSAIFAKSGSPTFTQVVIGPPTAPSNLVAVAILNGTLDRVTLTWVDNSNSESGFTIQRALNTSFTGVVNSYSLPANTITFVQGSVTRGTRYYYRIRAINAAGNSAWVNATPFPLRTP
jgi:FtsP/CotA-like multicopper oxidase with cupredoxin domain